MDYLTLPSLISALKATSDHASNKMPFPEGMYLSKKFIEFSGKIEQQVNHLPYKEARKWNCINMSYPISGVGSAYSPTSIPDPAALLVVLEELLAEFKTFASPDDPPACITHELHLLSNENPFQVKINWNVQSGFFCDTYMNEYRTPTSLIQKLQTIVDRFVKSPTIKLQAMAEMLQVYLDENPRAKHVKLWMVETEMNEEGTDDYSKPVVRKVRLFGNEQEMLLNREVQYFDKFLKDHGSSFVNLFEKQTSQHTSIKICSWTNKLKPIQTLMHQRIEEAKKFSNSVKSLLDN